MKVEQQYIDFFNQQKSLLDKNSNSISNSFREKAFSDFCQLGFPTKETELYRFSEMDKCFDHEFGINLNRLPQNSNLSHFNCEVPNVSKYTFYVENDIFITPNSDLKLPEGVIVCSLREAATKFPSLVLPYLGKLSDTKTDGIQAFNLAFAQDGFFIYIPENQTVEEPIQIINIMNGNVDYMANSHNLVILDKGAKAQMVVCDHSIGSHRYLANRITEIFVKENATYDHYKIESTSKNTTNISSLLIEQEANSATIANVITLHGGTTRNNIKINLKDKNTQTTLCGMAIENEEQKVDNYTFINHSSGETTSTELFKYILDDNAKGGFLGRILVQKDAQKTAAFQTNRNLCLTSSAHIQTKPQLEIYADDVKCSHGATVGQLDDAALFYLRSRGIAEKEAKLLLMSAFVSDVIDNIRIDSLKDRMKILVENTLKGQQKNCHGCKIC